MEILTGASSPGALSQSRLTSSPTVEISRPENCSSLVITLPKDAHPARLVSARRK